VASSSLKTKELQDVASWRFGTAVAILFVDRILQMRLREGRMGEVDYEKPILIKFCNLSFGVIGSLVS
jgi:hypothetical protein